MPKRWASCRVGKRSATHQNLVGGAALTHPTKDHKLSLAEPAGWAPPTDPSTFGQGGYTAGGAHPTGLYGGQSMKAATYEATVENGQIKLSEPVRLPEN